MEDRYTISSVQKALKVLRIFIDSDCGFSFSEIVSRCNGMNRSNVLRILSTLKSEGYLFHDDEKGLYYRGQAFFHLEVAGRDEKLRRLIRGDLEKASQDSGMIVHFTVFNGKELKILLRCYPNKASESLALASMDDASVPVHATGAGKVYVAFADDETRRILLSDCHYESYGVNTITDADVFRKVVEKVREDGYATNMCEHEEFLCCLTRPVFASGGRLLGALSFSGLRDMFQGERYRRMDELSLDLSQELSRRFSHDS